MTDMTTIAKIYDTLANGEIQISGTFEPPEGAATEVTLAAILSALASVAVTGPLTNTQLRAAAVAVEANALPLPEGAATETTLASILSALASVAVTGPLTDAQLRATALAIQAASLPLPTGAATQTTLAAVLAALQATLTARFIPDLIGQEQTVLVQLHATAWTPITPRLSIPDWVTRIMVTAPDGVTRIRLNGDPAGAVSTTATAGATLAANEVRIAYLSPGTNRTVGFTSAVAGGIAAVEFIG